MAFLNELRRLGRSSQRRRRTFSARDEAADLIEIAGAHFALVPRRRIAFFLAGELASLKFRVRSHSARLEIKRQLEHRVIERVESRERDELEPVAHPEQA